MATIRSVNPALSSICSACRYRITNTPIRQQVRHASFSKPGKRLATAEEWANVFNEKNYDHITTTDIQRDTPADTPPSDTSETSETSDTQSSLSKAKSIFGPKRTSSPTDPLPTTPSPNTDGSLTSSILSSLTTDPALLRSSAPHPTEPYHINVYANRTNTHITFTAPSREPILATSAGQLGYKNAQRKTFDASYQLAAYTMRKISTHQWKVGGKKAKVDHTVLPGDGRGGMMTIRDVGTRDTGVGIEVVLRGYGPGREAFTKALLGSEGAILKPMVVRVTDATRLKFGGTRSPQVKRR
jgi:small subunit ribosomal protein S11